MLVHEETCFIAFLFSVHDLNRLVDHDQREGGHSFGQDRRGAGLISVLSLSERDKKENKSYYVLLKVLCKVKTANSAGASGHLFSIRNFF